MALTERLYRQAGKRLLDIVLALAALTLMAGPMIGIALRLAWETKGSPFFLQIRIGRNGRQFRIIKFKTMSPERSISSFGQRLRSAAMDELPQLFQILTGQMSFVGPRPLIPEELSELDRIPGGRRRLQGRPGLTGLAQVHGPKTPILSERLRWDLEYLDRCSLWMDLRILLTSLGITFRGNWEPA